MHHDMSSRSRDSSQINVVIDASDLERKNCENSMILLSLNNSALFNNQYIINIINLLDKISCPWLAHFGVDVGSAVAATRIAF